MKKVFSSLGLWLTLLFLFIGFFLWRDDLDTEARTKYVKQKMHMTDVNFSEMDKGFEAVRFFADVVDMDDSQNNMIASTVRALFFDKLVATRSGELMASFAQRTPYEIRFWGDVRLHTTDRERFRAEEARYFQTRKELYTTCSVTIWKDDMVITGKELRYNTNTREGELRRNVLIRIWPSASGTGSLTSALAQPADDGVPVWNPSPRPGELQAPAGAGSSPLGLPMDRLPSFTVAVPSATESAGAIASDISNRKQDSSP